MLAQEDKTDLWQKFVGGQGGIMKSFHPLTLAFWLQNIAIFVKESPNLLVSKSDLLTSRLWFNYVPRYTYMCICTM